MSWRVVVVNKRSKLDYKMGFLVVRSEDGESRVHLGDISVLVIETTAANITAYLIAELAARKIKLIFCDNQHNPTAELLPTYGSYNTSGRIRQQIHWPPETKAKIWQRIIIRKIENQANHLEKASQDEADPEKSNNLQEKASQLWGYAKEVQPGDPTNREGHAAKVYFNNIFDENFYRNSDDIRNTILNYGYSVILACFNREIAAAGYLTQLGLWHDNAENPFNLGSDLMESFRPIVDNFARTANFTKFETEEKHQILDLLNKQVKINNSKQFLNNAIGVYTNSIFAAIEENNPDKILDWSEA